MTMQRYKQSLVRANLFSESGYFFSEKLVIAVC